MISGPIVDNAVAAESGRRPVEKIIILTISSFTERDRRRFGVSEFTDAGFQVEVWDITGVLYPTRKKHYVPPDRANERYVKEYFEREALYEDLIKLGAESFIIALINFDLPTKWVYEAITISQAEYAFNNCNVPPPGYQRTLIEKLTSKMTGREAGARSPRISDVLAVPYRAVRAFISSRRLRTMQEGHGLKPPRFLILGGRASDLHWPILKNTERIWTHAFDYDRYLEVRDLPEEPTLSKVAVFLDHGTPFQPDFLTETKTPPDPDIYYSSIRPFFELVETRLGLEVVIAAHPRLNIEGKEHYYGHRQILHGQTEKLVKQADLVIAHNSTSLSFANLFRKPVLFIGSAAHDPRTISAAAEAFGKTAHFLKDGKIEEFDLEAELKIDGKVYDRYRELYLKVSGTPDEPVWKTVAARIKGLSIKV